MAVTGRPASEQPGLVGSGESATAEAAGGSVREASGRVGEADPLLAGEVKEVAERRQPKAAITAGGEERFEVSARARCPVAHAMPVEVDGELGEDREALLDRVVGEWSLADPPSAVATSQQPHRVSLGHRTQRERAALAPSTTRSLLPAKPAHLHVASKRKAAPHKRCQHLETYGLGG